MVEKTKKTVQARANIAHKLARYVRAAPVHLPSGSNASQPSVSHLPEDEKKTFLRKRNQPKPSTGRKSITPGTIVIILSGSHRGRRAVALKNLPSGNLLVTGPYAINGVPLKRVNPAYVIATSTKVSLEGVTANIDETHFKKQLKNASEARTKRSEAGKQAESAWKNEAKKVQKTVDDKLVANIKKIEHLSGYLKTRFTLTSGVRPHELRF